jgi:EmrB/QacA subfamily drug resistance transporter
MGAFLAFADSTILNVAFPDIQRDFAEASLPTLSWVLNGYNIVLAALLVVAGRSADLVGRRRMYIAGVAVFVVASALCAAAGTPGQLIVFRLLQGVGAAMLIPASLGLVVDAFPAERRAHAIGLWGAGAALAAGLGPPAGGALIALGDWRLAFLVNVPIGLATVVLARRVLVEGRASGRRRLPDLRGAALLGAALALVTLGLVQGGDWGWTSTAVLLSFGGAVVAFAGYVASSRAHPSPLVDPALFRQRSFVVANVATAVAATGWYAYGLNHILWLDYVWGYSLLEAGLAVAPGAVVAAVVAGVLGRVADRGGLRIIIVSGAVVWAVALGFFYPVLVPVEPDFAGAWLIGQLITGVGVGATMPTLGAASLAGIPGQGYATASAVNSSVRQIGAVLGIAVLVVIVGRPTPETVVGLLQDGWRFSAICFAIAAVIALALGRRPRLEEAAPASGAVPVQRTGDDAAAVPVTGEEPDGAEGPAARRPDPGPATPAGRRTLFDVVAGLQPAAAERIELPAGSWLFREGDAADGMYLIESGRVEVVAQDRAVRQLGAGELVGELAVLTGGLRSAGIRAARDTVLSRISGDRFRETVVSDATALLHVATAMAERLQTVTPPQRPESSPSVVAVIGVGPGAAVGGVAEALTAELACTLDVARLEQATADGLERAERDHDVVVLVADGGTGPASVDEEWRSFCLRSADRVVTVIGPAVPPVPDAVDPRLVGGHLVWSGVRPARDERLAWHAALEPSTWHHVDPAAPRLGAGPLARRLARRSPALVLAGGGARAFAHIGVLQVLEEAGLEFDRVAGTSSGAMAAALWATGRSAAEVDAALYNEFVRGRLLGDYTVPVSGLIKGRRVAAGLQRQVGDLLIEELDRGFACVSVDLLAKRTVVHRTGPLADAVFASVRLPVVFSPMRLGNTLHIDGTVLDNLPVGAVAERDEGPIVAVDIGASGAPRRGGRPRMPSTGETLMRTLLLGGADNLARARDRADLVISPRTDGVGMLEWHELDTARAAGRAAAEAALPEVEALLRPSRTAPAPRHPRPVVRSLHPIPGGTP